MQTLRALILLSSGLVAAASAQTDSSLRAVATARGISVGAAVTFPGGNNIANRPAYQAALAANFNTVVAENAMKFQNLSRFGNRDTTRGVYNWGPADSIVEFALANNMKVRGHTLCWHSQTATWFNNLTGAAASKDTTLKILKEHIQLLAGRYKGKILEWDVVNEAIAQNGGTSPAYRTDSRWYSRVGSIEYIDSAFRWAHRVDSNALLFYNDFGGESMNAKGQNIYDLVSGLKQRGVPIHGVGLQAHFSVGGFDTASIGENMRRLAALGLRISITELDITNSGTVDSTKLYAQKENYKKLMALCLSVPNCKTFMAWGLNDAQSWRGANTAALLFSGTATLVKKPAYFGVVEALQGSSVVALTPAARGNLSTPSPALHRGASGGVIGATDARGAVRDLQGRSLPASVRRAMRP